MSLFARVRLYTLILLFSGLSTQAAAAESGMTPPFVLCGAYCAIVNAGGGLVSNRVFDRVSETTPQVIIYEHDGKRGALDAQGKRIIRPIYDSLFVLDGRPMIQGYIKSRDSSGPDIEFLFDLKGHLIFKHSGGQVGAWRDHPYYVVQCDGKDGKPGSCGTFFTDEQGRVIAQFALFYQNGNGPLQVASRDGKTFGYVGPDLKFIIPPRYTRAEYFKGGYALVRDDKGMGLVDEQGHVRIVPGAFKDLFGDEDDLFYEGFTAGDRQCGRYVRRDGTPVELPAGVCPYSSDRSMQHGYALVRGPHGLGAVDANGSILIEPKYAGLGPLTSQHLAFSQEKDGLYGMMDREGHVLIQPAYRSLRPGPAGTVVARQKDGAWVLLDDKGHRRSALSFYELEPLSDGLLSCKQRQPDGRMVSGFIRADGTMLPQHGSATKVSGPGLPARFIISDYADGAFKKGVMDAQGRLIVPVTEHVKDIKPLGDGLWRVRHYKRDAAPVEDIYDDSGHIVQALAPYRDIAPFRDGVTTAREKAQGNPVLINAQGRVLASYAALFPQYTEQARGGDGIVMQTLDRCYVTDPAAEPEDQPVVSGADRRICDDPALRKLSRETEKTYYGVQAGPCLPEVFMKLRPAYDDAVAACADSACLRRVMLGFQQRLAAEAKACSKAPSTVTWSDKPVSKQAQRALTAVVSAQGANYEGPEADDAAPDGQGSLSFQALALGKLPAALVTQSTGAHNEPFWLLARNKQGKWRIILQDYAGYLRGFDVAGATHAGLPILRIQQHASCCEHDVQYFQYDGKKYQSRRECTQLYDDDETPVLFCGGLEDSKKNSDQGGAAAKVRP